MSHPTYLLRKTLNAGEDGLYIATERWQVVKESAQFYYCISEKTAAKINDRVEKGGDPYNLTRRLFPDEIKKTKKNARRFAFATDEDAFKHLVFMKKKHLGHLQRSMAFCMAFLDAARSGQIDANSIDVPETKELVHQYFRWD